MSNSRATRAVWCFVFGAMIVLASPARLRAQPQSTAAQAGAPTPESAALLPRADQRRMAALSRNVPIDFWGKVVDQNGNPLAGVSIIAAARTYVLGTNGQLFTDFPKTNLLSATDGTFEVHGMSGDVFSIDAMDKEGYEKEEGTLRGYGLEAAQQPISGPDKPVVFRMWKTGLTQKLISANRVFKLIPDGRHYALDLTTGAFNEATNSEGDLRISLMRQAGAHQRENYDWSFEITPQDGGILQETNAGYNDMTLAPEAGYTSAYRREYRPAQSGWVDGEWQDRFFVTARGGTIYGRLSVNVNSFYDANTGQARLQIEYAVNPSGSPILR